MIEKMHLGLRVFISTFHSVEFAEKKCGMVRKLTFVHVPNYRSCTCLLKNQSLPKNVCKTQTTYGPFILFHAVVSRNI